MPRALQVTILQLLQLPVIPLHSSLQQRQRLKHLDRFKDKDTCTMVSIYLSLSISLLFSFSIFSLFLFPFHSLFLSLFLLSFFVTLPFPFSLKTSLSSLYISLCFYLSHSDDIQVLYRRNVTGMYGCCSTGLGHM